MDVFHFVRAAAIPYLSTKRHAELLLFHGIVTSMTFSQRKFAVI
jgi:hypothetical protein